MWSISELIQNFFTHKDFLPSADKMPGTMFTPLHFLFSACCVVLVVALALFAAKKNERIIKKIFLGVWIAVLVFEIAKTVWETFTGARVYFELNGFLPLYPCSIYLYAMPFALFGKGMWRRAGAGYMCTLGLIGGTINFVYPATILGNYSCISFAGFHTFFYHGSMVFIALVMLLSGYHSYRGVTKATDLLVPAIPFLLVSVIANLVNYSPINADYMFFKLNSFVFAPLGAVMPDFLATVIVYMVYLFLHAVFYLPSYIANKLKKTA
jgi:hypothetical protein